MKNLVIFEGLTDDNINDANNNLENNKGKRSWIYFPQNNANELHVAILYDNSRVLNVYNQLVSFSDTHVIMTADINVWFEANQTVRSKLCIPPNVVPVDYWIVIYAQKF